MKRFVWMRAAAASALIAACADVTPSARPRYGGTLRMESDAILRTLDPAAAPVDPGDAIARRRMLPLAFETLVALDETSGLRPLLATAWESDRRATRWRITLRSGVTLHDGTLLTAQRAAAALGARSSAWKVSGTEGGGISIELDRARPDLPWELADVRYALAFRQPSGEVIGTGPFRPQRLEPGRLMLQAHEDYWGGRAFADTVEIAMGRPQADQLAAQELGRVDIVPVRASDLRRLAQRSTRVAASRPMELLALVFESSRASPGGRQVRQALALAIDRQSLSQGLLQRQGVPALTLLPEWLSGYAPILRADLMSGADAPGHDGWGSPAAAKALVRSLPPDQRTVSLRIESVDTITRLVADRIVLDAREAGLTVRLDPVGTLAPRPDARLMRVPLVASSPERVLENLWKSLGPRVTNQLASSGSFGEPPAPGVDLDEVYRFERAILESHLIIPVVHLKELYAVGSRVDFSSAAGVSPTVFRILPSGVWDLANVSIGPERP